MPWLLLQNVNIKPHFVISLGSLDTTFSRFTLHVSDDKVSRNHDHADVGISLSTSQTCIVEQHPKRQLLEHSSVGRFYVLEPIDYILNFGVGLTLTTQPLVFDSTMVLLVTISELRSCLGPSSLLRAPGLSPLQHENHVPCTAASGR